MIESIEGDHSFNMDELLMHLALEKDARAELALDNFANEQRRQLELSMATHYSNFYKAARFYRTRHELIDFNFKHPDNGEVKTVSLSATELQEMLSDQLFDRLLQQSCSCQPVGETNVVECGCEEHLERFDLMERN